MANATGADARVSLGALVTASTGTLKASTLTNVDAIRAITRRMRLLALNALIEAAHAGTQGAGFSVVAQEVRDVAGEIEGLATSLGTSLGASVDTLTRAVGQLADEARAARGVDLALNAIETIDRNLYERTCDVRWWATDAAMVDCALDPTEAARAHATQRLGVILSSYTVYLDLWLCGLDGRILASGRPGRFAVAGRSVHDEPWFAAAQRLPSGDAFEAADVAQCEGLGGAEVATYVASVRERGDPRGRAIGYLAVHFDWEPQARAVVDGVRLTPEERPRSRVMVLDSRNRVLACSNRRGSLTERYPLATDGRSQGHYVDARGCLVAFHETPGYETYRGLGWRGVIEQARG